MPVPIEFKAPFACGQFYHAVFRSIDGVFLFRESQDRNCFLQKFSLFLLPVLNCWAYCLLDNHAHFIVCIKSSELLGQTLEEIPDEIKTVAMKKWLSDKGQLEPDELVERQINSFMVSYANLYNKAYRRRGGLFQSPFRRALISEETHLQQAVIYTHANAQKHGLVSDFKRYPHSSWHSILDNSSNLIDIKALMKFFGGMGKFKEQHTMQVDHFYKRGWPNSKLEY